MMRPPICAVCNKDFRGELKDSDLPGGTVRFSEYQSLPDGIVGHPRGLEWFCSLHIKQAKSLSYLTSKQAVQYIKLG